MKHINIRFLFLGISTYVLQVIINLFKFLICISILYPTVFILWLLSKMNKYNYDNAQEILVYVNELFNSILSGFVVLYIKRTCFKCKKHTIYILDFQQFLDTVNNRINTEDTLLLKGYCQDCKTNDITMVNEYV